MSQSYDYNKLVVFTFFKRQRQKSNLILFSKQVLFLIRFLTFSIVSLSFQGCLCYEKTQSFKDFKAFYNKILFVVVGGGNSRLMLCDTSSIDHLRDHLKYVKTQKVPKQDTRILKPIGTVSLVFSLLKSI